MKTYTITLPQLGRSFPAAEGTDLKRLLGEQGLGLDAPCGGKGTCGKCRVTVNGEERLACRTTVDRDMAVLLPEKGREAVLTEGAGAAWAPNGVDRYAMAFDVGTTTVVGYLLDGRTGETLETVSAPNPQRAFGADVISRIQHALTEGAAPCGTASGGP